MPALLWHNKHHHPLPVAIQLALRDFQSARHTRGQAARVCRLNPGQMPGPEPPPPGGLTLIADPTVPLDHLRVCTAETELPD